jgi:hypothetical protein
MKKTAKVFSFLFLTYAIIASIASIVAVKKWKKNLLANLPK